MRREAQAIRKQLRTPRAAGVAGILFSVLLMASMIMMRIAVPSSPLTPASDVLIHARAIALSLNLLPFAGIAFLWFIAVVRDRIGDSEDRFFVTVFLGSGYIFIATLFISAALAGAIISVLGGSYEGLVQSGAYALGRAEIYQSTNVYAVKMAGVFMITTSTVGWRTRIFPRWMAVLGYVLAQVLLWSVGLVEWVGILFPAWVFMVSLYILADNLRGNANFRS